MSVNEGGYLIQDIAAAADPVPPVLEAGLWFFYYFTTERGRRGLAAYRHRLGVAPGSAAYEDIEKRLAAQPPITVPAITLDGQGSGPNFPATDGTASAHHFTGPRTHRQVPGAGHNLPQEAPEAFAGAVLELARAGQADRRPE